MYIKKIHLENTGPISKLEFEFPFNETENPKPVIVIGQNGSGKSILLSYIVNSLINSKQAIYENTEVAQGRVYKLRSPMYIKQNEAYYFSKLTFESGMESIEWQLRTPKNKFLETFNPPPHEPDFAKIPANEVSVYWSNFDANEEAVETLLNSNCTLYFPANRFEEPGWLNADNLNARANFSDLKRIKGVSNRNIIQYSPLTLNKDWLLDILFDRSIYELQAHPLEPNTGISIFSGYRGPSSNIYQSILNLLQLILHTDRPIRFGIGNRKNRQISIMEGDTQILPNIFQLSTGESMVLNFFLSILRDYDLTGKDFQGFEPVRGIVLIDEIDLHLHSDLQFNVLPALIKHFPKIQFIISTHSPLFLLGMQKQFSDDGFSILSLPDGAQIGIERFQEFQSAYDVYKQTSKFQNDLQETLSLQQKPTVFVEGDYDIRYITKSAELLGKRQILETIELKDSGGFGGLDKIWKSFESPVVNSLTKNALLLYDCDIQKANAMRGKVSKKVIPPNEQNPISKGIENLFSRETIEKAQGQSSRFIDITHATTRIIRGEEVSIPEKLEVNPDEKGNLCNWICENGTSEDFEGFEQIFQILEEFLRQGEQI